MGFVGTFELSGFMPILHKKSSIVSSGGVQAVAAQPVFGQGANPDHQMRRKTSDTFKRRKLQES